MDRVQDNKHVNDILLPSDFNIDMFKSNPAWVSTLSVFKLHHCVQSAKRMTLTTSALVDHIYVNNPDKMIRTHAPNASISDHYPVCCTLYCEVLKQKTGKLTTVTYRSYKKCNAGVPLSDLSSCSFGAIYGLTDPDGALANFCKLFSPVYDKHVNTQKKRIKNLSLPLWLTTDTRKAVKKRDKFKKENYLEFKKTK